jgi:hypothetical protein
MIIKSLEYCSCSMYSQAIVPKPEERTLLTLPGEQLLLFTRMHWLAPVQTIIITAFTGLFLCLGVVALFTTVFPLPALLIISIPFILLISLTVIVRSITSWYFHVYIVTTRRIAEVCYLPLVTHYVNEILLDQVNCTEVDVRRDGLIQHILDIGSVDVTFDRPTHQDEFRFENVGGARGIGSLLTNQFIIDRKPYNQNSQSHALWFKPNNHTKPTFFIPKDIYPRMSM